jgi:hypothetical protein
VAARGRQGPPANVEEQLAQTFRAVLPANLWEPHELDAGAAGVANRASEQGLQRSGCQILVRSIRQNGPDPCPIPGLLRLPHPPRLTFVMAAHET